MAWTGDNRWVEDTEQSFFGSRWLQQALSNGAALPNISGLLGTTAPPPTSGNITLPSGETPVPVPTTPTPTAAPLPVPTATPTPTPTPTPSPTPAPTPADLSQASTIPVPTVPNAPAPYVPPPAPTAANASVADQLTGLLASDSPYMKLARAAGERTAHRRGMQNSSLAAGASEAAAIAAAAPIASQDASQIHARNQTELEGWTQLRNATTLQDRQDAAAMWRQLSGQHNQILMQNSSNLSAMERLLAQGDIEQAMQVMRDTSALTQTQINANVSLLSNYMSAFATLASNPELPASARNAYMREFLRVTNAGQGLVNALSGTEVNWPGTGGTGGVGDAPPLTPQEQYDQNYADWVEGAVEAMLPEITKEENVNKLNAITDPEARFNFIMSITNSNTSQWPLYQAYLKAHPKPVAPVPTG